MLWRRRDYNERMKAALLSFLTFSLCLSAQSGAQGLKSDLQSLRAGAAATPALTQQVRTHILQMAQKTHEPTAPTLQAFTNSLVGALSGHSPAQADLDRLAGDIQQTLQSAGTSSIGFENTIQDFEKSLMRAGVPAVRAHLVSSNLEQVGKDVRGPEDTPVR
jgi:hypothetical protein